MDHGSAGKEIRGIDLTVQAAVNNKTTASQQVKRENFEKILTFLASQRVRTSTVTPRDLANGNLKSLMRLILSLASHYKPHSVKQGQNRADSQMGNLIFLLPSKSISIDLQIVQHFILSFFRNDV